MNEKHPGQMTSGDIQRPVELFFIEGSDEPGKDIKMVGHGQGESITINVSD